METRTCLIEKNQFLIRLEEYSSGRQFLSESPFKGQLMDNEDVIRELGDNVIRVFRIDCDMKTAPVDITEECAAEYLALRYTHLSQARLRDEGTFPDYVKNSGVWSDFKADVSIRWPIADEEKRNRRTLAYIDAGRPVRGASLDMEGANV